jgi:hypothetical protein
MFIDKGGSMIRRKLIAGAAVLSLIGGVAAGCSGSDPGQSSQREQVEKKAAKSEAYLPQNDVELNNYNAAQKLYDTPSNIIWCTTTWGNASAPLVTVPIAGKLTSSSTTFFQPEKLVGDTDGGYLTVSSRSVDGLYHPNPPQYRYGFTPGGQYVDLFNMPTFCTTALTKFQRETTKVSVDFDPAAQAAQKRAEDYLKSGNKAAAQAALSDAVGGQ